MLWYLRTAAVNNIEKSVPVKGALLPNICSLTPPKKLNYKAPLSPLQTAWTS